ncbi:MAG TPA: ABC transporter permease [Kofleriaceae bacterium]|nr:ABC transporter permease [Kofleriaceae bacterium]
MRRPVVTAVALAAFAVLYAPLALIAVQSFNAVRYGTEWKGFTLDWYHRLLFEDQRAHEALVNTLLLAGASTAIATVLGTALALGLARLPWTRRARAALDAVVYLPLVSPDIVLAAAMLVALSILRALLPGAGPGLTAMILGHVTFQLPFVALAVGARLATIGPAQEEAARDLYADDWQVLRRVVLPQLWPGIAAGALLAFTLSLDDFVISFFTADTRSTTLPLFIQAALRTGISPEISALSTLIVVASAVLVLALARLQRKETA